MSSMRGCEFGWVCSCLELKEEGLGVQIYMLILLLGCLVEVAANLGEFGLFGALSLNKRYRIAL